MCGYCRHRDDRGLRHVPRISGHFQRRWSLRLSLHRREIPEMGMIKALNMLAGLLDTHRFMVKQERFVPEAGDRAIEAMGTRLHSPHHWSAVFDLPSASVP